LLYLEALEASNSPVASNIQFGSKSIKNWLKKQKPKAVPMTYPLK
jgi:hypothetical protein